MRCRELANLVTDYLEGRLSLKDRVLFRLHVGLCPRCWAYLRQMEKTVDVLGRVPDEPMPEEVRAELLARFRNWKGGQPAASSSENEARGEHGRTPPASRHDSESNEQ